DGLVNARDPAPYRANTPLVVQGAPADKIRAGSAYSFAPIVSNPDRLSVTFSGTGIPPWATFDLKTGALSGTPTNSDVRTHSGTSITATSLEGPLSIGPFAIEVVSTPWRAIANVPTPRHSLAVAINDTSVYAIDGYLGQPYNEQVVKPYQPRPVAERY